MGLAQNDSRVEQIALERSGRKLIYAPTEKITIIEVENFPLLGKLTDGFTGVPKTILSLKRDIGITPFSPSFR